jgi:serine/threonine protein kinase
MKKPMQRTASLELDPASLPVGTIVGPWRVERWGGRGTYGAVYRAVRPGHEEAGAVALKLAVHPEDPRFEREVSLLSRLRHPNVPRFLGQGAWRQASGAMHPYLAMQWVQGQPLYDWAAQRNPTSRQVLRVLAQVARALQAVHALQGVHRDVKGANILVRPADGWVFLTDFGSANYAGASRLTPQPWPPGTPAYRSPEAWRFLQQFRNEPTARYLATPADDLYALGVTAYRLVTDEYPPSAQPEQDTAALWRVDGEGPRPPAALNFRVAPRLNELMMQLLSTRPEARGSSEGMANKLEEAAEQEGPEANHPLFAWEARSPTSWSEEEVALAVGTPQRPRRRDRQVVRLSEQRDAAEKAELERQEAQELARASARTERDPARAPISPSRLRLFALAAGMLVMVGSWWAGPRHSIAPYTVAQEEAQPEADKADGGVVALGDEALPPAAESPLPPPPSKGLRTDLPSEPFSGQLRPPCPRGYVEVRGGCWAKLEFLPPNCPQHSYEWKKGCYVPIFSPAAPATSNPP